MLQKKMIQHHGTLPLPVKYFSSQVKLVSETVARNELEVSQQQFNTYSTVVQHPLDVESTENAYNQDPGMDSKPQQFIQQMTKEKGERGCIEQGKIDGVLQKGQQVNLSSTHLETFSPTNPLVSNSQQEVFTKKYQPVEILNSQGEWIGGYFVYKCLVVANLEGIERKYALVDKRGEKYVFWGEIRLPRVK